jgi:hypothetical protein
VAQLQHLELWRILGPRISVGEQFGHRRGHRCITSAVLVVDMVA